MNTEELILLTQRSLTRAMMVRSAPSGGLPIAFRSLLLALGEKTIMRGEPFKTFGAWTLIGDVVANYYIAGNDSLAGDLASMSDEPFPFIVPYEIADPDALDPEYDPVQSFKIKMTGGSMSARYMMVQFSLLGREYMKNMEYFPKTYNMDNRKEIGINMKSHVPAELFRTTTFRTQGKGADMYPMNPAEVFYTMYEMLEFGYDMEVEKLTMFKGFDLGSEHLTVFMKPEALYSLFNIGICAFTAKVEFSIDIQQQTITFQSYPFKLKGNTFTGQVERVLKKNECRFNTFTIDMNRMTVHITEGTAVTFSGVSFHTWDEQEIRREIEANFFNQLYQNYYHFAHEVDIKIEDKLEMDYKLESRSVRETLIQSIENFKEITRDKYLGEIAKIEEQIKELRIYERVTRPYVAKHVQELLLEDNYTRSRQLKKILDNYHATDPEQYPEITQEEVDNYIWLQNKNDIVANLNNSGHEAYRRRIEKELAEIEVLQKKVKDDNIIQEARDTFYRLSQEPTLQRKSPVKFLNSSIDLASRERLIDYVSIHKDSDVKSKIHYYPGYGAVRTSGENLPNGAQPLYTLTETPLTCQEGNVFQSVPLSMIPKLGSQWGYMGSDIRGVFPEGQMGLYLTSLGRLSVNHHIYPVNNSYGLELMDGEYITDYIPLNQFINTNTLYSTTPMKIVITRDTSLYIEELDTIMEMYRNVGELRMEKHQGVRAIELISDLSELNKMYIWNKTSKEFVKVSDVDWNNLPFKLDKNYNPYYLISGSKKAYVDGIHLPLNILEQITGYEIETKKFTFDYNIPKGIEKYIASISSNPDENSPEALDNVLELIDSKVKALVNKGDLSPGGYARLAGINFIREI